MTATSLLVTCVNRPPGYSIALAAVDAGAYDKVYGASASGSSRLMSYSTRLASVEHLPLPRVQASDVPSEAERAYVEALVDLCERLGIGDVWPCNDEEIFLLSKHREHLMGIGIRVLVNEWRVTETAMDKLAVNRVAHAVGFPAPAAVPVAADGVPVCLPLPLIVKASRSTSSAGVRKVATRAELDAAVLELRGSYDEVFVEEYISGDEEISINLLVDEQGDALCCFGLRKFRYIHPSWSTSAQIVDIAPAIRTSACELVRELGLTGFVVIQTKVDRSSGELKLVELNTRFGNITRVLLRMVPGLGEAAVTRRAGRMEPPTPVVGRCGVSLVDDLLAFVLYLWHRLTFTSSDDNRPPSVLEMLKSYVYVYRRRPAIDDYTRMMLFDPLFVLGFSMAVVRNESRLPSAWKQLLPWGGARTGDHRRHEHDPR